MQDWADFDWQGDWDDLRQHAMTTWEGLNEEDLDVPEGNVEALVTRIQEHTGDSAEAIRTRLMAQDDMLLDSEADDFDSL